MPIDFSALNRQNLHHAYLIEGDYDKISPILIDYLKKEKIISGDSDIYRSFAETFSIDLSRLINSQQIEKSAGKFFILGSNFFTREASNSMLKMLEEPSKDVHFFLITPNPHLLPATLRSRLSIIRADNKRKLDQKSLVEARQFLALSKAKRIDMIKEVTEKFKKDKEDQAEGESGLKSWAMEFLNAVESLFYEANPDIKSKVFEFEELQKCRGYMSDTGSSAKMLLEHLALILPTTK